jgi:hypothetical protein
VPCRGLNIKPRWEEKDDMMLQAENMAEMVERNSHLQPSDHGAKVQAYNAGPPGSQSLSLRNSAPESQAAATQNTTVAEKSDSDASGPADSGGDSNAVGGAQIAQDNQAQAQEQAQEKSSGMLKAEEVGAAVQEHKDDVGAVSKGGVTDEK